MASSNEEVIKALSTLEDIRSTAIVKNNKYLFDGVNNLQVLFTRTLTDLLTNSDGLNPTEINYLRSHDGRLSAIKSVRNRTNCPMSEAKEKVDKWMKDNGMDPSGGQR